MPFTQVLDHGTRRQESDKTFAHRLPLDNATEYARPKTPRHAAPLACLKSGWRRSAVPTVYEIGWSGADAVRVLAEMERAGRQVDRQESSRG